MVIGKEKSRKLSVYEFFKVLQIEWIVSDLRHRIYTGRNDKDHWKMVMECKKVKIEDIAIKNKLPSIFTDAQMKSEFEHLVYLPDSIPNFHYKNEEQKQGQGYIDLMHYYSTGSDVRCEIMGETKVGKIKKFFPHSKIVHVDINGTIEQLNSDSVIRIL